jgi:hypothetical protein
MMFGVATGISMLAAAHDSRVKSIASMSCWVDLEESFLGQGETIRKEAARFLQVLGELTGNVGEDLNNMFNDYFKNQNLEHMAEFVYNSSAINYIDKINANGASIFIANALSDSLFTPNQFPRFFEQLTTINKHIEFAPGDHAGPELAGLVGLPDQVWNRANIWFDYYLRDRQTTPITTMSQVIFNVFHSDNDIDTYNSWDEVTSSYSRFYLDKREGLTMDKSQQKSILTYFEHDVNNTYSLSGGSELSSLTTGKSAHINGGIAFISATVRAVVDFPRHFIMPLIDRIRAGVFVSDRFKTTLRIRGVPMMSLTIIPQVCSIELSLV